MSVFSPYNKVLLHCAQLVKVFQEASKQCSNFQMVNINVPAGVGASALDTQLLNMQVQIKVGGRHRLDRRIQLVVEVSVT